MASPGMKSIWLLSVRGMHQFFWQIDSFSKANFAALTRRIAEAAVRGDALCAWLFEEAGRVLGRHIRALAPAISPTLTSAPGGLRVVCVGSVWKSWDLLKKGFLAGIKEDNGKPVSFMR